MLLKPVGERITVKPLQHEDKTPSGIIIPDTAKEKPLKGEVQLVGKLPKGIVIASGDIVVYGKYAGTEIDGLLILDVTDVLAIQE